MHTYINTIYIHTHIPIYAHVQIQTHIHIASHTQTHTPIKYTYVTL